MVKTGAIGIFWDTEATGGVSLRVGIDDQNAEVVGRERSGQVDSGGCFANAAFLVGNCENSAQAVILPRRFACWTDWFVSRETSVPRET